MEVVHLGASTSMTGWHKQASWAGNPDDCSIVSSVPFPQLMPGIPWGILYDYLKGKKIPSAWFMDGSAQYVNETEK